ncbi:MAG: coproporphyrinogen III oxidase [Alphaproteobacteria bacterium]|nr:coproporphyrinogen III oxidase [Alphaproteobacteria bacterium]
MTGGCVTDDGTPGFAVYLHWPYCEQICPYCDFNVRLNRAVDDRAWQDALQTSLRQFGARSGQRTLTSLYFGGGTPSLMPPALVASVIDQCRRIWRVDGPIEITLEANPTDAERSRFEDFRAAGVNRLSLGVQSFDDEALRFLGRNHGAAEARDALDAALSVFGNVSFDMIYALPDETPAAWRRALRAGVSHGAPHLSLYQLTIEAGTAFARAVERAAWSPPDNDAAAELYDVTQEETARAGLPAYEVSNHARAGARSRHNLTYWRGGDYVGVGPGAHGRLTIDGRRYAIETIRSPKDWLSAATSDADRATTFTPLSDDDAFTEKVAMGLRSVEGVRPTPSEWSWIEPRARMLEGDGLLMIEPERIVATAHGRRVLNAVTAALLV